MYISNGFSYFRERYPEAEDFFYSDESREDYAKVVELVSEADKVFASFVFTKQFSFLKDLINAKWTIGGPALNQITDVLQGVDCEKCFTTYEENSQQAKLSTDFCNYWDKFVDSQENIRHLHFGMSIGIGCYWNKCTFCNFDDSPAKYRLRDVIDKIPDVIVEKPYRQHIYTGIDSTLPRQIAPLVQAANRVHTKNSVIHTYIRLDDSILMELEKCNDLSGLFVMVGPEVFSQRGIDIINKNVDINNLPRLVRLMSRGLSVHINIIHNWNFFDEDMYNESMRIFREIKAAKTIVNPEQYLVLTHKLICNWFNLSMVDQLVDNYGGVVKDINLNKLDLSAVSGIPGKNIWPTGDSKFFCNKLIKAMAPNKDRSINSISYQIL